jgi:LPXTG-site transpeptidase (sortase) family protein
VLSLLLAFLAGLAFTLWLARRPEPTVPRFGSPPPRREGWLLLAGAVAVAGAVAAAHLQWAPAPPAAPPPAAAPAAEGAHKPARLLIPTLRVDAPIITIPLRDGQWDISRLDAEVGWLESTGQRPDDDRAMAFVGHVTLSALDRGPFADLWTLPEFSEVIYRAEERDYVYAVSDVSKAKPDEVERLFQPGGERLLLITCTNWNYLTDLYDGRLIAEAVLVRRQPWP